MRLTRKPKNARNVAFAVRESIRRLFSGRILGLRLQSKPASRAIVRQFPSPTAVKFRGLFVGSLFAELLPPLARFALHAPPRMLYKAG